MEYNVIFSDGTKGYLSHHGVKGMHWGVWNSETRARKLGAKQYQKKLNRYDREQQGNVVGWANASGTEQRYMQKANAARVHGNDEKHKKYLEKAKIASSIKNEYIKDANRVGKEYHSTLKKMQSEGYSFKITPTNFNSYFPGYRKKAKQYVAKYGKIRMRTYANASSGNRWKVKDPESISDSKNASWTANKHYMVKHRPQAVYYM